VEFFRRATASIGEQQKQAMLPTTAEILDNRSAPPAASLDRQGPIFPPGVPRGLRRMLENELSRLLARSSSRRDPSEALSFLWARRVPCRPAADRGRGLCPGRQRRNSGSGHYPQIETKLTVRGIDMDDISASWHP
jgi:nicotinamide-nucleotide amidase